MGPRGQRDCEMGGEPVVKYRSFCLFHSSAIVHCIGDDQVIEHPDLVKDKRKRFLETLLEGRIGACRVIQWPPVHGALRLGGFQSTVRTENSQKLRNNDS